MGRFTIEDLKNYLRASAGEDEEVNLDRDVAGLSFTDIGYDSLAVMETTSRIEQELGVMLPEAELADIEALDDYVSFVNSKLAMNETGIR